MAGGILEKIRCSPVPNGRRSVIARIGWRDFYKSLKRRENICLLCGCTLIEAASLFSLFKSAWRSLPKHVLKVLQNDGWLYYKNDLLFVRDGKYA